MKRRRFILYLTGAAATSWASSQSGLLGSLNPMHAGSPRSTPLDDLVKVSRASRALGAQVRLIVYHDSLAQAEAAISSAFAALERIEGLMSLYREDSQLSRLNRDGILLDPHPDFLEVLTAAKRLSEQSDGAFDVTIQPLWEVYAARAELGEWPEPRRIEDALKSVDWRRLEISPERVQLRGEGTQVTLNGIAQGYAADRVRQIFENKGIRSALIDTGEIGALGTHARKDEWTVGIKHPRQPGAVLELAALKDRCLATSGDYETRFGEGFSHHHLLDPRTGSSAAELSSVSIAAPCAMQADALSTAVFILGIDRGMKLIESMPGADALFVTKEGEVRRTENFPIIIS